MITEQQRLLIARTEKFADKTIWFWTIFMFEKDYVYQDYVNFHKWETITLVHRDSKYEHEFYNDSFRGVLKVSNEMLDSDLLKNMGNALSLSPLLKWLEATRWSWDMVVGTGSILFELKTWETVKIQNQEPSLMSEEELNKLNIILDKIELWTTQEKNW